VFSYCNEACIASKTTTFKRTLARKTNSVRYDDTVGHLRQRVEAALGIPPDQQQLFWHKKELSAAHDSKTLTQMHM